MRSALTRWSLRKAVLAVAAIAVVAVGGAYAVLALQTTGSPAPASLPAAPAAPDGAVTPLEGAWKVSPATDDFVGYRVREKLGILPAPDDAVGRTRVVDGTLVVRGHRITRASFAADLTTLRSDAPPRDEALRQEGLETARYPRATFRLRRPVELGDIRRGAVVHPVAEAMLTLHDVTRPVRLALDARWNGASLQLVGRTRLRLADFGIELGQRVGLKIAANGTMEAQLTFRRPGQARPVTQADTRSSAGEPDQIPVNRRQLRREAISHRRGSLVVSVGGPESARSDLFEITASGTTLARLTRQAGGAGQLEADQPAVVPGTRTVVFARRTNFADRDPSPQRLYALARGEHRARPITPPDVMAYNPAASPDGRRLAFTMDSQDGEQLFTMPVPHAGVARAARPRALVKAGDVAQEPAWSPDGSRLAFTCFSSDDDLCIVDADGRHLRRLTRGPAYDDAPTWSPDGSAIAFSRDGHLYRMAVDGSRLTRLTSGARVRDSHPRWSHDGSTIAFVRSDTRLHATFSGPGRLMLLVLAHRKLFRVPVKAGSVRWASWTSR
jgi:Tol biopolymer transport system component/polyisoprenoid-binding protein YceI